MMKRFGIIIAACMCMLAGCEAPLARKQQAGAAVEVNGHYLYRSSLDSLTSGMNSEDSLRVAQQYISQWAKDMLEYDAAYSYKQKEIEQMAEEYRRMLYIQAYEERLIDRRMPKTVSDATAREVYEKMPDRFRLDESIVKGLLLVVTNDAKDMPKLRSWMSKQMMDQIEKYAYQNATGYELFMDRWVTVSTLTEQMPIERTEIESLLKNRNQIEVSDSLKSYILQVTDKHLRGEQMPMEYARPEIEQIVLGERQVEFLQKERERLYNEAIQDKKVNFY